MRVAFFEVKDWERAYLTERLPDDTTYFDAGTIPAPGGSRQTDIASGAVPRDIDALFVFRPKEEPTRKR
jgi:hypothetical protein